MIKNLKEIVEPQKEHTAELEAFGYYLEFTRRYSLNTVMAYKSDVSFFLDFLQSHQKSLRDIDIHDLLLFLESISSNYKTRARYLAGIKNFFFYLENFKEYEPQNQLFEHIKIPKLSKHFPNVLEIKQVKSLLDSVDLNKQEGYRDVAILESLYSCGLRVSELLQLSLADIDLKEGWLKITGKGDKERFVPLGASLKKRMKEYLVFSYPALVKKQNKFSKDKTRFFLTKNGGSFSRISVWKLVKKYAHQAGIDQNIYPHTLRHTFATHLLFNGADLRVIQTLLGHAQLSTTKIYTHIKKEELFNLIKEYHPLNMYFP